MLTNFLNHKISISAGVRLFVSIILAMAIALVLSYSNYLEYWTKTIYRVQTVDFNMLSHTLPIKLSLELQAGNIEELQRTLDSNYGLFGIVTTNCKSEEPKCPEQEITYVSSAKVIIGSSGSKTYLPRGPYADNWLSLLSEDSLDGQVYVPLRNPPPRATEWEFKTPHDKEKTIIGHFNTGKIIGRVYFIRNPIPLFSNELKKWLKYPFGSSSANILYGSSFFASILTSIPLWLLFEWQLYIIRLGKEREQIANNKVLEEKNKALKAENDAFRYKALFAGFQESLDSDYSSVLANHLEEIQGFFRRLDNDIDNITHDLRKAPLLSIDMNRLDKIANKLRQHFSELNNSQKEEIIQSTIQFLSDTDQTVKSINWVLEDLRQIANIDSTNVEVQATIQDFLQNLPPNLQTDWLSLDFMDEAPQPLFILCNEWHLRSIIKNVMYNAATALNSYRVKQYVKGKEFNAKILITCSQNKDNACIQILDNGPGFPLSIANKLYQSLEKISQTGQGRGSIIVFSYLQLYKGKVQLENSEEGGAKITFLFPLIPVSVKENIGLSSTET